MEHFLIVTNDGKDADGRVTVLTDEELTAVIDDVCRRLSISLSGKAASGNGARENGKKEHLKSQASISIKSSMVKLSNMVVLQIHSKHSGL